MKELLDLEFFAEWGLQVVAKLTDNPVVIQFTITYDAKKRKDMHKKDEAIQFDFNIENDDPNVVVKEMVSVYVLMGIVVLLRLIEFDYNSYWFYIDHKCNILTPC